MASHNVPADVAAIAASHACGSLNRSGVWPVPALLMSPLPRLAGRAGGVGAGVGADAGEPRHRLAASDDTMTSEMRRSSIAFCLTTLLLCSTERIEWGKRMDKASLVGVFRQEQTSGHSLSWERALAPVGFFASELSREFHFGESMSEQKCPKLAESTSTHSQPHV